MQDSKGVLMFVNCFWARGAVILISACFLLGNSPSQADDLFGTDLQRNEIKKQVAKQLVTVFGKDSDQLKTFSDLSLIHI